MPLQMRVQTVFSWRWKHLVFAAGYLDILENDGVE